jgi:hypothetical protein
MSLDRCLFATRARGGGVDEVVERRLERLTGFYGPLGAGGYERRTHPAVGVSAGSIELGGGPQAPRETLQFGGSLAPGLDSAAALRAADDATLRSIPGAVAAIAADDDGAALVTGPVAPTMLYEASSDELTAWSTHAVAAALLATGSAAVDPRSLPTFVASEYVGGARSLVAGVRAVPPATLIIAAAGGVAERSYWPAPERWRAAEPGTEQRGAELALLETLDAALSPVDRPVLGLTGGADSRVVAVAMRELGLEFEAMTFGEPEWPDVREGARIAGALGVAHRFQPLELWSDDEALRRVPGEVRWNEGAIHIGFGRVRFPASMGAWVTGAGAETGRAYYHRRVDGDGREPDAVELGAVMRQALAPRLAGASREAVEGVGERIDAWLAAAEATGARGWRALDVLYGEQRLRSWGRANLPHESAPMVFAFGHPRVQRALASLPVADQRSDAFQRRFIGRLAPEVALAPAPERSGLVGRALRRVGLRSGARSPLADHWADRPEFRSWVADELLASPLLVESLGGAWVERVRGGFERGDAELEALALWVAAPAALDRSLAELNRGA